MAHNATQNNPIGGVHDEASQRNRSQAHFRLPSMGLFCLSFLGYVPPDTQVSGVFYVYPMV